MQAGDRIREYILEEQIGIGGFGEVWRARDEHVDKRFAIKVLYAHLWAHAGKRGKGVKMNLPQFNGHSERGYDNPRGVFHDKAKVSEIYQGIQA